MTPVHATITKYLEGYAERPIPAPPPDQLWDVCVVIPAYAETPGFLDNLGALRKSSASVLVVLVINRPDSDPDMTANHGLRSALLALPLRTRLQKGFDIRDIEPGLQLLVMDVEARSGATSKKQGVGLARKTGCDLALSWYAAGSIRSPWLYSCDADAQWPDDYFRKIDDAKVTRGAVTFPFFHAAADDREQQDETESACLLYELRLHHYVLGLSYAGSPYAFHTLGSCLAVHAQDYAAVRGFPRRAGGEDFYLLNKVAKLGGVHTLSGQCIRLSARASTRVPFGTGPAVEAILAELATGSSTDTTLQQLQNTPVFYHPACFEALKALLDECEALAKERASTINPQRTVASLPDDLAEATLAAVTELGLEGVLPHCQRQSSDATSYRQHLYQWLDGFRSLKFIHALRSRGFPDRSLHNLQTMKPDLLAIDPSQPVDPKQMLISVRQQLGWTVDTTAQTDIQE